MVKKIKAQSETESKEEKRMNNKNPHEMTALTLDPDIDKLKTELPVMQNIKAELNTKEYNAGIIDEGMLSDDEKLMVNKLADEIDITNADQVMKYGVATQKGISDFSISVLNKVKTKDLGDVGKSLKELTVFLNSSTKVEKKGIGGLFQKVKRGMDSVKATYEKAEANVKQIEKSLERHQVILAQDISLYAQMYDLSLKYYRELTMYIIAGKKALDKERAYTLFTLKKKAEMSEQQEDMERYRQHIDMCNRFDKKLHDLELSRVVSLQMAPQIRMIQNNDQVLFEKIQSSLNSTIPLWRNQVVIQLGIDHTKRAIEAQEGITEATNNLIRENAGALRVATAETAKAAERPIIDIETLRKSNQELIDSIKEVIKIHEDGAKQRKETQGELLKIESELKSALREIIK